MARFTILLISIVATSIGAIGFASARPSYFTQVERIILPDGRAGELRIVNGDSVVGSDPQALLVLNGDNHVIARSPRSYHLQIICRLPSDCKIFDFDADTVLELEPSTFNAFHVAKDLEGEETDWWSFLDQQGSWGVRSRAAIWAEVAVANWSLLKTTWLRFAFVMTMGIGAGFSRGVLPSGELAVARSRLKQALVLTLRVAFAGLFVLVALTVLFAGRWTGSLWLIAFFSGMSLSFLTTYLVHRRVKPREFAVQS